MKFSIKNFNKQVIKDNVDNTVSKITQIIKEIGPRESGSKEAFAAQEMLRKELETFTDEVHYENYKMAPKAFLHFTKTISVGISAAIGVGTFLKQKHIGPKALGDGIIAGTTIAGLGVTVAEFLLYKKFCDPLYKQIDGHNLVATRKATEETKKRIIISGHIDSAYEWRHIYYGNGKLMTPLMVGTIVSGIATAVVGTINTVGKIAGKTNPFLSVIDKISLPLYLFTIPNMATLFAFVDFKTLSPGANDNLTGTMAAYSALKMLDDAGIRFKNTEVQCIITDGEEAGLRGCKQMAIDHKDDYTNSGVETSILCVDTLTDLEYLNVYNRDMTGTVKHDQKFAQLVMDSAKDAGHDDLKFASVFFGSSDAAAFTQAGISATCLAAMDPSPADYYHNRRDNYDRLQPDAIETGYDIIMSTIFNFADEEIDEEEK